MAWGAGTAPEESGLFCLVTTMLPLDFSPAFCGNSDGMEADACGVGVALLDAGSTSDADDMEGFTPEASPIPSACADAGA
mmetsp:Transcript_109786/g.194657  ORF Transcript_109786/g.194657 Transcript_109786/m.194657 type:complete len:80 (-) Transcript_109786:54-293(-)